MNDDWITTNEAAQLSGYEPQHVRFLIREEKIVGRKWGRDWQVERASLLTYVEKMEKAGQKRGPKPAD